MHGLSTAVVLLTMATLLDEIGHLTSTTWLKHTLKPCSIRPQHPPGPSYPPPLNPRWWPILNVAASPVFSSNPYQTTQQQVVVSFEEPEERTRRVDGESHATPTHPETGHTQAHSQPDAGSLPGLEEVETDDEPAFNAPMGWADPRLRGGQMLDFVFPGLGEPLNVIISGLSDPYILTPRGLLHYVQTLGFSTECFGIHLGMLHVANLGDALNPPNSTPPVRGGIGGGSGQGEEEEPPRIPPRNPGGNKTELLLARQNYDWPQHGWPDYGTCLETLIGGNHFRAWKQDGAGARTGAWFLAASREMWLGMGHAISPDGYNGGREGIVKRALKPTRWSPIEEGIWWRTTLKYNHTLIPPGNAGINHKISQDGRVAILTVRRRQRPPSKKELWDAWSEVAHTPPTSFLGKVGSWFDRERWAEVRKARWELEGIKEDELGDD